LKKLEHLENGRRRGPYDEASRKAGCGKSARKRVAELESGTMKYCGVHQPSLAYRKGHVVSYDGSAWCATRDVSVERPGHGDGWQLMNSDSKPAQWPQWFASEPEALMTRAEALALTIRRCDEAMARQLEDAEILLIDQGATAEELERAFGPHGYARKMFREDRDAQIREVAAWLSGNDNTLH
jgi:hypothetical protein